MQASEKFFEWIRDNAEATPAKLRLKYPRATEELDYPAAITQIECRRKFAKKLGDTLAAFPNFYFPSVLAGEQSTSDLLAAFHTSLVAEGLPAADFTAGLGIEALHAASRASEVTAIERDQDKTEALDFNAQGLDIHNIKVVNGDCVEFLDRCIADKRRFATVFIDPARRAADGSRVFALSDCEPDVVGLMPKLAQVCDLLIIKASPMLDISHTAAALTPTPTSIMAIGTPTDCKELLAMVNFAADEPKEPMIEAVTLHTDNRGADITAFTPTQEREAPDPTVVDSPAKDEYIYEASPALMKTGAYRLIAKRYNLSIFHPNTRLFTSKEPVANFPGNCYKLVEVLPYASRVLKRFAKQYPAINVATRNFGMSADALRNKLGVRDGGPLRLYGITNSKGEKMLVVVENCGQSAPEAN